jgi:hypothetical protein
MDAGIITAFNHWLALFLSALELDENFNNSNLYSSDAYICNSELRLLFSQKTYFNLFQTILIHLWSIYLHHIPIQLFCYLLFYVAL